MLRQTLVLVMAPVALLASISGRAEDLPLPKGRSSHYTVRFGAMVGELEPVAGEVLCNRDHDCEILLAFVPQIAIRLLADRDDVRNGWSSIDCAELRCGFATGSQAIRYSSMVNDLRILTGRDMLVGEAQSLAWRSRTQLGRFTFAVAP